MEHGGLDDVMAAKEGGLAMAAMTENELRMIYQREILPPLLLDNPEEFYTAFERGPEAAVMFFREKWAWMGSRLSAQEIVCPVTGMDCVALDENEESFAALLAVELSPPQAEKVGLARYTAVFFGVGRLPRLFYGEYAALPNGAPTLEVAEYRLDREGGLRRHVRAVLHQGCDRAPLLFPPPADPPPEDASLPLMEEAWYTAFLDAAARSCADLDKGKRGTESGR